MPRSLRKPVLRCNCLSLLKITYWRTKDHPSKRFGIHKKGHISQGNVSLFLVRLSIQGCRNCQQCPTAGPGSHKNYQ